MELLVGGFFFFKAEIARCRKDGVMLNDFKADGGSAVSSHIGGTQRREKEPQVLL